jgi:hypothetical protein
MGRGMRVEMNRERKHHDSADADFAGEHDDLTVADHVHGGPERKPEPESPMGYSGMDEGPSRVRERWLRPLRRLGARLRGG